MPFSYNKTDDWNHKSKHSKREIMIVDNVQSISEIMHKLYRKEDRYKKLIQIYSQILMKKITLDYQHFEISLQGTMVWSYITDHQSDL